jgi:hypothetical protein
MAALASGPLTAKPPGRPAPWEPREAPCGASAQCAGEHTITLQNFCNFPVWFASASGAFGGASLGAVTCKTDSDCCVTLPDGTVDCVGNTACVNGTCAQKNCTATSNSCPTSPAGLVTCNVPQCGPANGCPVLPCSSNDQCPGGSSCVAGNCQVCNGNDCTDNLCSPNGTCPCQVGGSQCTDFGPGSICDAPAGSSVGTCAGGTCWYSGLVPENGPGAATTPQWQLAASCWNDAECAPKQSCNDHGLCTCASNADCTALGGVCSGGVCTGQVATVCMPQGWDGRIWGRTGCSLNNGAFQCQTGQCGSNAAGVLQCTNPAAGVAETATGATLFEMNADADTPVQDFWDVSLVSGYNLPLQVVACNATGGGAGCQLGGQSAPDFPIGCVSDLNQTCPAPLQIAGQCNCISNSDCPQGQTCGANNLCSWGGSGPGSCTVTCIDPDDSCDGFGLFANASTLAAPAALKCNDAVSTLNGTTYDDYYGCGGALQPVSCNNGAAACFADNDCPYLGQTCQGNICTPVNAADQFAQCVDSACNPNVSQAADYSCQQVQLQGQSVSLCLPNAPDSTTESGCCGAYNSGWLTAANAAGGSATTPFTQVFRSACQYSYSFQYDDVASSFQCPDTQGEVNYLLSFCQLPVDFPRPRKETKGR